MPDTGIGSAVRRTEDQRFLTGTGHYTDDINRPGQAHVWFVRSPHAHAAITKIDTAKAKQAPGVVAVYTGADTAADKVGGLICGWVVKDKNGQPHKAPGHPVIALDTVRHVGDQVAAGIAETQTQAPDAAELIEGTYQTQPSVIERA